MSLGYLFCNPLLIGTLSFSTLHTFSLPSGHVDCLFLARGEVACRSQAGAGRGPGTQFFELQTSCTYVYTRHFWHFEDGGEIVFPVERFGAPSVAFTTAESLGTLSQLWGHSRSLWAFLVLRHFWGWFKGKPNGSHLHIYIYIHYIYIYIIHICNLFLGVGEVLSF